MTLADGIILGVVVLIITLIFLSQRRGKTDGYCAKCSYNKSCGKDDCKPAKKGRFD